jgi:RNA-splicing ligase RtcB
MRSLLGPRRSFSAFKSDFSRILETRCKQSALPGSAALTTIPMLELKFTIFLWKHATRSIAEEAPEAYKNVRPEAADHAGPARTVARFEPTICIKG